MIRINLVAPEKTTQKKRTAGAAPTGALQFYILLILLVGGAAAVCVAGWVWKSTSIATLNRKIGEAQERQRQLQAIKDQVDALEAKRKMYQMKVDLIERLRRAQSDPVHMLDEMSKALPDLVWLRGVEQAGPSIRISGSSNGLTAVADFMSALQRSGWFPQVEMGPTKESKEKEGAAPVVEFSVTATFKNPETAAREAAEKAAEAARATPTPAAKGKGKKG
jgi:type IV pilus assembly protein PilN